MTRSGFWLKIRFEEPVVLSASSATAGEHRTLDFVPGSAILGIAASALYAEMDSVRAFRTFHAGGVSFGNAYPVLDDGTITIPAPLSLHFPKAESAALDSETGRASLFNRVWPEAGKGVGQIEQLRDLYVGGSRSFRLRGRQSLRTAIARETGTASEGQLFGYSALPAGSVFAAWVSYDPDLLTLKELTGALAGARRLGRSRSAEYGKCMLSILEGAAHAFETAVPDDCAIVLCLSDVALADENGAPSRAPEPADFGLSGGAIDWTRSHLRSRRYSPFNTALRTYETERIVIEKGSVIVFAGCATASGGPVEVGQHRSAGLGQAWVNPAFLSGHTLGRVDSAALPQSGERSVTLGKATPQFAALLNLRAAPADRQAVTLAESYRGELIRLYRSARTISGKPMSVAVGPTRSQWGRLQALADKHPTIREWLRGAEMGNVFGREMNVRGRREFVDDERWGTEGQLDADFITFHQWLKQVVQKGRGGLAGAADMDSLKALLRMGLEVAGTVDAPEPQHDDLEDAQ